MACSSTTGATMMMSERQNNPRGRMRLISRNGLKRASPSSGDAVWDKDIADTADGLEIERKLWILFNLTSEARYLHVDRAFERHAEPRAEIGAREGAACVGREELEQGR